MAIEWQPMTRRVTTSTLLGTDRRITDLIAIWTALAVT
jgi:hypothetical protein